MFILLRLVLIIVIIGALGMGGWYVTNLKADLATSEMNNKLLQDGIKDQQALLDQIKKDVEAIQTANKELAEQNEKQREDVKTLTSKFSKRDFGALAHEKPGVVERLVNRGTVNAMRCLEIASGSPLTEQEKNAKTPTEANRECPSLINPAHTSPN